MDTVLVVGGRTTGLMMAAELARRGVPVRCIDKSPGIDPHVRANLLHSRTLEIFQGLGLSEQVTRGSVSERGFVFYRGGERVLESPHAPIDSPFPYGMSQSQAHTEATLEVHLNGLGVAVERDVSLTAMEQDEAGVTVTLQHGDSRQEAARCAWLVACDGAHSEVRHLTGMLFPGDADTVPYILGDVMMTGGEELEPDKGHIFFHEEGELYLFTRLPRNRHFLVASLDAGAETPGTPPLETLQAIVTQRAGRPLRLTDPHWLGYFRINYRLAPHYRRGRVFLAGDAAHVHSLLAGHGMNTGIQDAHNLAWKLALVARGHAGAELLDSYESERRPVADAIVGTTRQITDTLEQYAGLSQSERDRLVANLFTPEPARLEAARQLQEVDIDYGASPLTLAAEGAARGGPAPGARAPDATDLEIAGKATSLFRVPADDQFRLYIFRGDSNEASPSDIRTALEAAGRFASWLMPYIVSREPVGDAIGAHAAILDRKGTMHRAYAAQDPCIYVIRPDGYVACSSSDLGGVGRYFEHLGGLVS